MPKKKYPHPRSLKFWLIIGVLALFLMGGGVITVRSLYFHNLRPVSSSTNTSYFTVVSGTDARTIASKLKREGLIRNSKAFETYVRSNELFDQLQAGTYILSPSMSVQQIVDKMVKGDVAKNLLTILPAKRLDQIKKAFLASGYSQAAVDAAFDPANYRDHPALASLPPGASLEGYLYPDSYQKQANTPAETIIRESLDEMQKYLTTDVVDGFTAQGLTIFQAITVASIVEQETADPADQPTVAQVFLSRLKQDMMLGSDVTAFYASAIAGVSNSVATESPYNTRIHIGLPPGPIGNVTADTLRAVAHPATTTYLYFVAGDDGTVHFSHTEAEHEDAVQKYCTKLCQ